MIEQSSRIDRCSGLSSTLSTRSTLGLACSTAIVASRLIVTMAALSVLLLFSLTWASPPPQTPILRTTVDRDNDLFDALLEQVTSGNESDVTFADVDSFCRDSMRRHAQTTTAFAKWSVRLTQLLTAMKNRSNDFTDELVDEAAVPIDRLLSAYPDHSHRLFLQAERLAVARAAARHDAVLFSISRHRQDLADRGLRRLTRLAGQTQALADKVAAQRSQLNTVNRNTDNQSMTRDLTRLQRSLIVDSVQIRLMQTEFLEPGSRDFLAAASQIESAARNATTVLPSDSTARREIELLQIDASIRSGQPDRAETQMAAFLLTGKSQSPALQPRVVSLQIRIDLADGKTDQAFNRVKKFYGSNPRLAPKSIDMDLAALETLIARIGGATNKQTTDQVMGWIDTMQSRGGTYARRRAEAITLRSIPGAANLGTSKSGSQESPQLSPALLVAQGEDRLRQGEIDQALNLLASAARAESDPTMALKYAAKTAAAAVGNQRVIPAVDVLKETAITHRSAATAAAVFLQAVSIDAKLGADADKFPRIEESLRELMNVWPKTNQATQAQSWLLKILAAQQRSIDAAEVALVLPSDVTSKSNSLYQSASQLWMEAFANLEDANRPSIAKRFYLAFEPHLKTPDGVAAMTLAAACCLDKSEIILAQFTGSKSPDSITGFSEALFDLRVHGKTSEALAQPEADLITIASSRLMRDGRLDPQVRKRNANLVTSWQVEPVDSISAAERLLWTDQTDAAIEMIRRVLSDESKDGGVLRDAAECLSRSRNQQALAYSTELWDRLSSGSAKGSDLWHEAKLGAIAALIRSGRSEEAQKRAAYVLLTTPPSDTLLRDRYETAGE